MTKIGFIHPDLGIGGAERLILDAALALKKKGHHVRIFTAHHDPGHCFPETKDGQLQVTCVGDWLPRTICGFLAALCAYIRMIYVALYVVLFHTERYDVLFVDQISACIPFLRIRKNSRILYYCHFPDQLLTERKSFLKRIYRTVIDRVEEITTGMSDVVLVNSNFTAGVFRETFKSLNIHPSVLYPSLNFEYFDKHVAFSLTDLPIPVTVNRLFLSINRYERKKNIALAIEAFHHLLQRIAPGERTGLYLVIAGGYDYRVQENVEHFAELEKLTTELDILDYVQFLKSPSDDIKIGLLKAATALLYTPDKEHFGIVPLEAMYCGTPVIAVNSGGPLETVIPGETGFLCPPNAGSFAEAMENVVSRVEELRPRASAHVRSRFSFDSFATHVNYVVQSLVDERKTK